MIYSKVFCINQAMSNLKALGDRTCTPSSLGLFDSLKSLWFDLFN